MSGSAKRLSVRNISYILWLQCASAAWAKVPLSVKAPLFDVAPFFNSFAKPGVIYLLYAWNGSTLREALNKSFDWLRTNGK
jgi:hypothetical protein